MTKLPRFLMIERRFLFGLFYVHLLRFECSNPATRKAPQTSCNVHVQLEILSEARRPIMSCNAALTWRVSCQPWCCSSWSAATGRRQEPTEEDRRRETAATNQTIVANEKTRPLCTVYGHGCHVCEQWRLNCCFAWLFSDRQDVAPRSSI